LHPRVRAIQSKANMGKTASRVSAIFAAIKRALKVEVRAQVVMA